MKVFMVGATGLLGCKAAIELIKKGHQVSTVSLPPLPQGANMPKEMQIVLSDINKMPDSEVERLLDGADVFIFAAGVDERVEFPAPVLDYYRKYNIEPLKRLLPLCKKCGVKKAIVFGSYFSLLAKERPQLDLCSKHKYIASRIEQEQVCESFADEDFSVCVLELPYIFGTQPGRKPVWTILIEQIEFMDKWPFTLYPKGGTAMLTATQVGQVVCGAAEKEMHGFSAIPIGMYNMKWDEFLPHVYHARGMKADRKIVGVAPWMMKMGMFKPLRSYKERGVDPGINPLLLPEIMDVDLFIDPSYSKDLGAQPDDIAEAIADSIRVSCAAHEGKAKLLDMAAE